MSESGEGRVYLKGKRVLITGISGFIGLPLARHLSYYGAEVYGLDLNPIEETRQADSLKEGGPNPDRVTRGDIRNLDVVISALEVSKPDIVFHLAALCFIPSSFENPSETIKTNILGTYNVLDAIVQKGLNTKVIFAGSSEEYGLVKKTAELPINEANPLRPVSPYARSKVGGEALMHSCYHSCGVDTVVCRCFNTEGPRRGAKYVTSVIASQLILFQRGEIKKITIGNVNAFRDWSHIEDIVEGYCLLARKGKAGEVYNLGSQRTNSVLSYILLCLEEAGYVVEAITTSDGRKRVENPSKIDDSAIYKCKFEKTLVDKMMLNGELKFTLADKGLSIHTDKGKVPIEFKQDRFRPKDVAILLSDISKIRKIGYKVKFSLRDIVRDQLHYFSRFTTATYSKNSS